MNPESTPPQSSTVDVPEVHPAPNRAKAIPFALALLCFLLPFMRFSCVADPSKVERVTGISLVLGGTVGQGADQKTVDRQPWAIGGAVAAVLALVLAWRGATKETFGLGLCSIGALIALLVDLSSRTKKESLELATASGDLGLWGAMVALAVGAIWCITPDASKASPPEHSHDG